MHSCLRMPEVAGMVCDFLRTSQAFASLASLAQSCRVLQEPALDALWAEQDTLLNLIQCLPLDLWAVNVDFTPNITLLARNLCSSDLPCLLYYAAKIKRLIYIRYEEDLLAIEVGQPMVQMICDAIGSPLLPKLQDLTWVSDDDSYFRVFMSLCGHSLKKLVLSLDGAATVRLSSLAAVARWPSLNSFEIRHTSTCPALAPAISKILCHIQGIRKLVIPALPQDAFEALASLPSLRTLALGNLYHDFTPPPKPIDGFVSLQSLNVNVPGATDAVRIIQSLKSSCVRSLGLTLSIIPNPSGYLEMIGAVQDVFPVDRLAGLRVSVTSRSVRPADCFIPATAIELLLPYDSMYGVILTGMNIELNDSLLLRMAEAWPNMRTLHLGQRDLPSSNPPAVTLLGLRHLAKLCRRLTSLSIEFESTGIEAMAKMRPGEGVSEASLITLHVGQSPSPNPELTASFLSDIFPSLEILSWSINMARPTRDKWVQVNQLLGWFGTIRQQERAFREESNA
ncbi:hypothetical protein HGRIS_001853 [Hohenbuehelia grisea]|uniref:F-box domain-containing protein n=1 Tax=Hohenbuehelia grisea TaxID=104357 RepID=A0ABR3JJG8_9AGAR